MTLKSYDKVLKFWLGENESAHKPQLWFKLSAQNDQQISSLFHDYLIDAENDLLSEWQKEPRSCVALIIILDQFSRNIYRGTASMFQNDEKAVKIALDLINDRKDQFDSLNLVEKFFVYLALLHSENLSHAKLALEGIQSLANQCPAEEKTQFSKYYQSSKTHYDLLETFGRYPHRNSLLGRKSNDKELDFLHRSKHNFVKSVQPLVKPATTRDVNNNKEKKKPTNIRLQSVLFLHGFRQNSNKLKRRLHSILHRLKVQCNVTFTFLNGTFPYSPNGEISTQLQATLGTEFTQPIESQRVWFNSDDQAQIYKGFNESVGYVTLYAKQHGPFDGIVGFGQGAVLAAVICAKHPDLFRYFIGISGFEPRSLEHKHILTPQKPLRNLPSLHIYGQTDNLITANRSEQLAKCFDGCKLAPHSSGHFVPYAWPMDKLTEFLTQQAEMKPNPKPFLENQPLELKIIKLNQNLVRYELSELDLKPLFTDKSLLRQPAYVDYFNNPYEISYDLLRDQIMLSDQTLLEDKLILLYVLLLQSGVKEKKCEFKNYTCTVLKLILEVYTRENEPKQEDYLVNEMIEWLFVNTNSWKELVMLCNFAYVRKSECVEMNDDTQLVRKLERLYDHLIKLFYLQIIADLKIIDRKHGTQSLHDLTQFKVPIDDNPLGHDSEENQSLINQDNRDNFKKDEDDPNAVEQISDLAPNMPRIKLSIDKTSRIARECAHLLNPYKNISPETHPNEHKRAKILSYNHYRKILSLIGEYKTTASRQSQYTNPRVYLSMARYNKKMMEYLMNTPLSDAIVNPVPEPVDVSSHEEMKPLYDWLEANRATKLNEQDLKFLRGVVTTDGRLDLCKQVIGPDGIQPLLDRMKDNRQIDRLLLGNNIIGDDAGNVIAEFIKSRQSPLKVWYIAGNNLTVKGISPIAEALRNDTQVTGLWLKRNPLKAAGMVPIAGLISHNVTLQVLDLLNCGLLDEGVKTLFESMSSNRSLRHLYLSANGITTVGLGYIRDYYAKTESLLETLFLGCNRIGNDGAKIVAECLRSDSKLMRLNLASSRIGAEGMKHLAQALISHPRLMVLDMGYMRSTVDLGELGNYIEDEGALHLSEYLKKTDKLISLNITHNHIKQKGIQLLVDALKLNRSLVFFDYVQYGISLNEITLGELRKSLIDNRQYLKQTRPDLIPESVIVDEHVNQIYSVYRTH